MGSCHLRREEEPPGNNLGRFKAIVIALSFPDGMPEDIQVSLVETGLTIRGSARNLIVSEHIDLPCAVETRTIRVDDDRGTMYLLLRKK